jgi:hypothetical protein
VQVVGVSGNHLEMLILQTTSFPDRSAKKTRRAARQTKQQQEQQGEQRPWQPTTVDNIRLPRQPQIFSHHGHPIQAN